MREVFSSRLLWTGSSVELGRPQRMAPKTPAQEAAIKAEMEAESQAFIMSLDWGPGIKTYKDLMTKPINLEEKKAWKLITGAKKEPTREAKKMVIKQPKTLEKENKSPEKFKQPGSQRHTFASHTRPAEVSTFSLLLIYAIYTNQHTCTQAITMIVSFGQSVGCS